MLTFKGAIADDVGNTFADTDEFFELMMVDGKPMRVCIDAYFLQESKGQPGKGEHMDGVWSDDIVVYIPTADYGNKPKVGKLMLLGKKAYTITSCQDESGIYTMVIKRNRQ